MSAYHPVEPPRRWRRRNLLRRVPWRALTWLAGTAGAAGWWAAQPEVGWPEAIPVACCYGLLRCPRAADGAKTMIVVWLAELVAAGGRLVCEGGPLG
ncbi:MAG: hypothetical protein GEV12_10085 [Micromonosporaceae bacterium]|nr:hypothetical protein [Micromonosporaceae bacterium]